MKALLTSRPSKAPEAHCAAYWRVGRGYFPGGQWILVIERCPFCGQKHSHGGGVDPARPSAGHRYSHCWKKAAREICEPGYELVVAKVIYENAKEV